MVVNDIETGRPEALVESALISARRTAASAVLATRLLAREVSAIALVGCGFINSEVLRFVRVLWPGLERVTLFDLNEEQAAGFAERLETGEQNPEIHFARTVSEACGAATLVSIATTASEPHIHDVKFFRPGTAVLHVSLRDLSPQVILACDNIVDDPAHVCRARTSIHLTEKFTGNRNFIRCSIGEILLNRAPARIAADRVVVFSPFGLGILDLAVARFVVDQAVQRGLGIVIPQFLPSPWRQSSDSPGRSEASL
jgi:ornithine cyclodeaminase